MRQHPIDLLSESIRVRAQARVRTGRYVGSGVSGALVLVVLASHSHFIAARAQRRLQHTEEQAAFVLALDQRAAKLNTTLTGLEGFVERYNQVALSLPVSSVMASVCNQLPSGVTLDKLHIEAGRRRPLRSPRSRGSEPLDAATPRQLTGEITGFAVDDDDVAELVERLSDLTPLDDVNLDFSRTRVVRGLAAREFRLSFTVDLEVEYEIRPSDPATSVAGASGPTREPSHGNQ